MEFEPFRWYMVLVAIIVLSAAAVGAVDNMMKGKIAQEAIKAGLVQDAAGHWVRPALGPEKVTALP